MKSQASTLSPVPVSCIWKSAWRISKKTTPAFPSKCPTRSSLTERQSLTNPTSCACPNRPINTTDCTWRPCPCPTVYPTTLTRTKWPRVRSSRRERVTSTRSTSMTSPRPVKSGASAQKVPDQIYLLIAPRVYNIWMRSRIAWLPASSGPPKRYFTQWNKSPLFRLFISEKRISSHFSSNFRLKIMKDFLNVSVFS